MKMKSSLNLNMCVSICLRRNKHHCHRLSLLKVEKLIQNFMLDTNSSS